MSATGAAADPLDEEEDRAMVALFREMQPMLAGVPSVVVGAVLANLTAIWVAGHVIEGEPEATRWQRVQLLRHQCRNTSELVELFAQQNGSDLIAAPRGGSA